MPKFTWFASDTCDVCGEENKKGWIMQQSVCFIFSKTTKICSSCSSKMLLGADPTINND